MSTPEPAAPAAEVVAEAPVVRSGYLYWVFKVLLTPVMTVAFRPSIEGIGHVPRRGGALLACNHTSYLDWLLLPLVVRTRRISFLAKLEYFTRPGLRGRGQAYFFSATGQVPIDRAGASAATAALRTAGRLLREGRLVGVFPEGTRTRDGRLNRGRTGVARMAAATGAPVVPCATVGTFAVAPPGARVPRPRKIAVRFGEPMPPVCAAGQEPTAEQLRDWTDELMARICALSGQVYSGVDAVGRR
jgi:1-acyl-sn-glycerol-3-phosphate acyltransferase